MAANKGEKYPLTLQPIPQNAHYPPAIPPTKTSPCTNLIPQTLRRHGHIVVPLLGGVHYSGRVLLPALQLPACSTVEVKSVSHGPSQIYTHTHKHAQTLCSILLNSIWATRKEENTKGVKKQEMTMISDRRN